VPGPVRALGGVGGHIGAPHAVMIRVLELLVSTRTGGGPRHVLTLASALRSRGFDPIVAGPRDGALFEAFRAADIETVELATDGLSPRTLARLARLLRTRDVHLVHSHGKGAGFHGRLAARLRGIPAIHTFHGIHFEAYPPPARMAYLALERALGRWTAAVVNVSHAQETEGLALELFTRAQSRVIVNGVDVARLALSALDRDAARTALGIGPDARVVGCAARLDPVKGVDRLLRACAAADGAGTEVVIIGAGREAAALQGLAAAIGLGGRARFVGEIPDAARLFRAFDVYASAARKEGMPLALIEAMALGLPVVASDIAAHREVLGASTGLVEPGAEAFGRALRDLLASPEARRALGAANRARSAAFDAPVMVDAVAALYRAILGL
jgi:glycosyltransferase involved in cell wall biosynthesis